MIGPKRDQGDSVDPVLVVGVSVVKPCRVLQSHVLINALTVK